MKNRKSTAKTRQKPAPTAGFTLIELLVVIAVFGIITGLAAANWGTFMEYQGLKEDAMGIQRDLMAFRGRAMDQGDTIEVTFGTSGTKQTYSANVKGGAVFKTVTLNRGKLNNNLFAASGEIATSEISGNEWASKITITPNNLTAFGQNNRSGHVVIEGKKDQFCILKPKYGTRPQLYHKKKVGGSWRKM